MSSMVPANVAKGREIVRLVQSDEWTAQGSIVGVDPAALHEVIASFEGVKPLVAADPKLISEEAAEARKWLKPIGMKSWPDMAAQAKTEWLSSILLALSLTYPARIIIRASQKALEHTYRFPNEAETKIREIADEMVNRNRISLARLKSMAREIERAAHPEPVLPPPPPKVWTPADVRESNRIFRNLGITQRYRFIGGGEIDGFQIKKTR